MVAVRPDGLAVSENGKVPEGNDEDQMGEDLGELGVLGMDWSGFFTLSSGIETSLKTSKSKNY